MTYVFTSFAITLDFFRQENRAILTETLQRLYENRTVIVQSSRYWFKHCMMPLRCHCGLPHIISRAYDHMIILILEESSRSACGARRGIMRSTCDVSTGYGLAIFPICQSAELNKMVEATMSVNPYVMMMTGSPCGVRMERMSWTLYRHHKLIGRQ